MASIISKKVKGHTYYYYVESRRVDGKPKYVNQTYLGSAESVLKRLVDGPGQPLYSETLEFGAVCTLHDIAGRIGLAAAVDGVMEKRSQGAGYGDYAVVAAINRACAPAAKSNIGEWYAKTQLPGIMGIAPGLMSGQNFHNHMDMSDDELRAIDDEIVAGIVRDYGMDTSRLIYDATNFVTYIDTATESELAQRGHSKEKRNDLRIVGLSMMIDAEHAIPLLYETYPGNRNDARQFAGVVGGLRERLSAIGVTGGATVVFDRGNNSASNIALLGNGPSPLHYVGGLRKDQCADVFATPTSEYSPLEGFDGTSAYRTKATVFGREMTVVATRNQRLLEGQLRGIMDNAAKAAAGLADLAARLARWADGTVRRGARPTAESAGKAASRILSAEYMTRLFDVSVGDDLNLVYGLNGERLAELEETELGKTVLFTDRHDWTDAEIVGAYRSAWRIEHGFRQMKDAGHLSVRPVNHWTDSKIKVHMFYCVMALRLCGLMRIEAERLGIETSVDGELEALGGIRHVITVLGTKKTDVIHSFTKSTETAERLAEAYHLREKYGKN